MEVVDFGGVPADAAVDLFLSRGLLRELLGRHGVACFVMVPPAQAAYFYTALISNASATDVMRSTSCTI
jgi:hypothetical protein